MDEILIENDKLLLEKKIEAVLFSAEKPLSIEALQKLFTSSPAPSLGQIREVISNLQDFYQTRGVILVEVASGFRFQVSNDAVDFIGELSVEKPQKHTRAFLETLALVAYRQPITRAEVEEVRGVQVSSNIIKQLLDLEWIRVVGHKEVPGKPELFATTKIFLDHFGLTTLEALPPLSEMRDIDAIARELEAKVELERDQAEISENPENFANFAKKDEKTSQFSDIIITQLSNKLEEEYDANNSDDPNDETNATPTTAAESKHQE
jgi:segregation and condensation protein B